MVVVQFIMYKVYSASSSITLQENLKREEDKGVRTKFFPTVQKHKGIKSPSKPTV